ncbi:hypothetical protein G9P44_005112 [Scheffersomyces stipitis]|nr:hypothetical protein G9P44_005112 [Scheffersomyces stipitis]
MPVPSDSQASSDSIQSVPFEWLYPILQESNVSDSDETSPGMEHDGTNWPDSRDSTTEECQRLPIDRVQITIQR